jgi:hypothetical protein
MIRRAPAVVGIVLLTLLVVGTCAFAGTAKRERVSDGDYARRVCSTLTDLHAREATIATEHAALDASDPAAFQHAAVALLERYVAQIRRARADLGAAVPASDARASRPFDRYLSSAITRLDRIARKLRNADPHAAVSQADVSTFEANLQFLAHELPDPFARVRDQALLAALRDEPACNDIVSIGQS